MEKSDWAYRLVVFINDNKESELEIEAVPSTWIEYNEAKEILECYYMPDLNNSVKRRRFHEMLRKGSPPGEDWPKYEVDIRGHANSYEEAQKKLKRLETEPFAYTTEDEAACHIRSDEEKKYYRMRGRRVSPSTSDKLEQLHVDLEPPSSQSQDQADNNHPENTQDGCQLETDGHQIKKKLAEYSYSPRDKSRFGASKIPQRSCYNYDNDAALLKKPEDEHLLSEKKKGKKNEKEKELSTVNNNERDQNRANRERSFETPKSHRTLKPPAKIDQRSSIGNSSSRRFSSSSKDGEESGTKKKTSEDHRFLDVQENRQRSKTSALPRRISVNRFFDRSETSVTASPPQPSSCPPASGTSSATSRNDERHFSEFCHDQYCHETPKRREQSHLSNYSRYSRFNSSLSPLTEAGEGSDVRQLMREHYISICKQMSNLKGLMIECINKHKNLEALLITTSQCTGRSNMLENNQILDFDFELPCSSLEKFEELNKKIAEEKKFRSMIIGIINSSIDKKRQMVRCLGDLIRRFVNKEVGLSLVPIKATPNKKVFKGTPLCNLIKGIYCLAFGTKKKPLSETAFMKEVQGVLHNTKYWRDTQGQERRSESENEEEVDELGSFDEEQNESPRSIP